MAAKWTSLAASYSTWPTLLPQPPSNTLWLGSCALLAPSISNSQQPKVRKEKNHEQEREREIEGPAMDRTVSGLNIFEKKVGALMWLGCERGEGYRCAKRELDVYAGHNRKSNEPRQGLLYIGTYSLILVRVHRSLAPPSASSGPILFSHSFYKRIKSRGH